MIAIRFNGSGFPERLITVHANPIPYGVANFVVHTIYAQPESDAHQACLDLLASAAFPRRTWRERLVNPRRQIERLTTDLQVQLVRALCPVSEVFHGIG